MVRHVRPITPQEPGQELVGQGSHKPNRQTAQFPPLEQGDLQLLLQIFDVPGQRRLGEMQPLHDARKMQFLRYGQKTLQATGQPDGLCFKLFPRVQVFFQGKNQPV